MAAPRNIDVPAPSVDESADKKPVDGCIFCKITCGQDAATTLLYDTDGIVAFKDLFPVTQHHILVVPKKHIRNAKILTSEDIPLVERLLSIGQELLTSQGVELEQCRFGFHWPPFNSINHLHMHCIAPVSQLRFLHRWVFRPHTMWFVGTDQLIKMLRK